MSLKIAFCTTCKGRTQHLKLTLPRNLADNADYSNAVFVLLDYGSPDDLFPYLRDHHAEDLSSGRLIVYSRADDGPFRMAHAKNVAHRLGILQGAEVLVNLDADNFTGRGLASYLNREFTRAGDHRVFFFTQMIKGVTPRGITGKLAVTRQAFRQVGGYDERYEAWGPDDRDFNHRLQRLGYQALPLPYRFSDAIRHNDRMRFKEYPDAASAVQDYSGGPPPSPLQPGPRLVNYGRFGCSTVWETFQPSRVLYLDRMPTRVFGIGMHKTGTVSLHQALQLMGLDSVHWPSAHWAKAVWAEMRQVGRSSTLERHYAATDFPLPLLYRELDQGYPGSKFILTIRDENAWLESVRRHWDPQYNLFRSQWDRDPFTHRCHLEAYGRRQFDPEVMLARYRRHNASVQNYFSDRPEDLLVLDLDRGEPWARLSEFLRVAVPRVSYPQSNVTADSSH